MKRKWLVGLQTLQFTESGLDMFCFSQFATIAIALGLKEQSKYGVNKVKCVYKGLNVCEMFKKKMQCDCLDMIHTGEV